MILIEERMMSEIDKLNLYRRYVDDTLIFCKSEQTLKHFVTKLNSCHPNLKVTHEAEAHNSLPFLDILITRRDNGSFSRAVYRKPTWTGQYLHFSSFTPVKHKRSLVRTLFTRARRICSLDMFESEFQKITQTLIDNGYTKDFIEKYSRITQSKERIASVPKQPIYLEILFKGDFETEK